VSVNSYSIDHLPQNFKVSISLNDLMLYADKYVEHLEKDVTTAIHELTCLCEWQHDVPREGLYRLIAQHPYCPAHSRSGFLVHFMNWLQNAKQS